MMLVSFVLLAIAGGILHRPGPHSVHPAPAPSQQENSLPPSQFEELRRFAMAHARETSGPRLKNPRLATGGIDRELADAIANQRPYFRSLPVSTSSGKAMLGSTTGRTTLLSSRSAGGITSPQNPLGARAAASNRSICVGPQIRSVNGIASGPIFTPVEPDNYYRIEGCAFGSIPGLILLRPNSQSTPNTEFIRLTLNSPASWTDSAIDVRLDPRLKGFSDSPVNLIVHLSSGRELQLSGCMFVASRSEPQLLTPIPAGWVSLDSRSSASRAIRQLEYESPPVGGSEVPSQALKASAYIARSDRDAFESGKDSFNFSELAPGWSVESVQLVAFAPACPGQDSAQQGSGVWSTSWNSQGFAISWVAQSCVTSIPPIYKFALHSSQYAARVWVVGPAGTEPLRTTSNPLHQ